MKRIESSTFRIAAVLVVAAVAWMASFGPAVASNMGFRLNKGIAPVGFPAPIGENWVSLPYTNLYATAEALCVALGMTPGAGRIRQVNPMTGVTASHTCGSPGPFPLAPGRGVIVNNPAATAGIIAGSHPAVPPAPGFSLVPVGFPPPIGFNMYPVPYNSTACTAQDLCAQLGLPAGTARVLRRDAAIGVTASHTCGSPGAFPLVLGEAVLIQYPGAPIVGIVPAHF